MALKIDISEKYKPEFPFIDDSKAMEKLSYESFTEVVDNHIKELYQEGGLDNIFSFRDEYKKRLDFVRSKIEHSPDNRELENCDLCYSYCVERAYYFIEHPALLKDERLPKECLDILRELADKYSAKPSDWIYETALDYKECQYEIVDGGRKGINSFRTLSRRVKQYYPDLHERTMVQK